MQKQQGKKKTWLPTETLRFRQYLGVQYENPRNIVTDSKGRHALPMVAVYLLGHCVGDIEEPVIYVRHQAYDYNEQLVTKGIPNAFVDCLTHDSIIVQIPRLHGKISNRLDEILSIFDQSHINAEDQHVLDLDDSLYAEDDIEVQRIIRRLLMAATDANMRMDINVEDEYFSLIESLDTDNLHKAHELAEKTALLKEKDAQLEHQQYKARKLVKMLLNNGLGGAQYTLGEAKFGKLISPNAQLGFGYQFAPWFGGRIQANGWQSKGGWCAEDVPEQYKFKYVAPGIDLMFNLSNLTSSVPAWAIPVRRPPRYI